MANDMQNKSAILSNQPDLLDVDSIKADFPILKQLINGNRLVYLDSAATTQKPASVIVAMENYYRTINANIHRGLHTLSEKATSAYEHSRQHVAQFIGGTSPEEIIFTRGATESINLVAYTWGETNISEGDEIVLTEMEHHANIVPWVILAQKKKAVLKITPITSEGLLDLSSLDSLITPRTKLVAVTHMSNVLGTINPVNEIVQKAKAMGAVVLIDGAQAAPHMGIDVTDIGADFYTFSGHKMLGPAGVGVLYGRQELLEEMPPFIMGGEMIRDVSFDRITWNDLPHKFEAGTPSIGDVVAFDAALHYLEDLDFSRMGEHERALTEYTIGKLDELGTIEIHGPRNVDRRGGVVSFTHARVHPHDVSTFLDTKGIAVRAGNHCAQPLTKRLGKVATTRVSLYVYNDKQDIDLLCAALVDMERFFGV
jgi:cysteine desulfurase/selenocysteine lyase